MKYVTGYLHRNASKSDKNYAKSLTNQISNNYNSHNVLKGIKGYVSRKKTRSLFCSKNQKNSYKLNKNSVRYNFLFLQLFTQQVI